MHILVTVGYFGHKYGLGKSLTWQHEVFFINVQKLSPSWLEVGWIVRSGDGHMSEMCVCVYVCAHARMCVLDVGDLLIFKKFCFYLVLTTTIGNYLPRAPTFCYGHISILGFS